MTETISLNAQQLVYSPPKYSNIICEPCNYHRIAHTLNYTTLCMETNNRPSLTINLFVNFGGDDLANHKWLVKFMYTLLRVDIYITVPCLVDHCLQMVCKLEFLKRNCLVRQHDKWHLTYIYPFTLQGLLEWESWNMVNVLLISKLEIRQLLEKNCLNIS